MTAVAAVAIAFVLEASPQSPAEPAYLGFDRNTYPGDANLQALHKTFSYTGYWLNNPPGERTNTWAGHRAAVESAGIGFLVLLRGRLEAKEKAGANERARGISAARNAGPPPRHEGFPAPAVIFLDQE